MCPLSTHRACSLSRPLTLGGGLRTHAAVNVGTSAQLSLVVSEARARQVLSEGYPLRRGRCAGPRRAALSVVAAVCAWQLVAWWAALAAVRDGSREATLADIATGVGLMLAMPIAVIVVFFDVEASWRVAERAAGVPSWELRPYFSAGQDARVIVTAASLNGGNVLAALGAALCRVCADVGGGAAPPSADAYARLEALAAVAPGEAAGCPVFSPLLLGERHAPGARGVITRLGRDNLLRAGDLYAAATRGLARNLAGMLPHAARSALRRGPHVVVSGGAVDRSASLRAAIAAEVGCAVVHNALADAAMGAALLAAGE